MVAKLRKTESEMGAGWPSGEAFVVNNNNTSERMPLVNNEKGRNNNGLDSLMFSQNQASFRQTNEKSVLSGFESHNESFINAKSIN